MTKSYEQRTRVTQSWRTFHLAAYPTVELGVMSSSKINELVLPEKSGLGMTGLYPSGACLILCLLELHTYNDTI